MRKTRFKNASGLPNKYQYSTARDLALMSQRIMQDFPQYYPYFSETSFLFNGRKYNTHNRLVLNFSGAEGLKTGYTRMSGYNLVTTAERSDNRLIGVVMGGRTARSRDAHMHQIMNASYERLRKNPSLLSRTFVARPSPRLKPSQDAPLVPEDLVIASLAPTPVAVAPLASPAASLVETEALSNAADPIGALISQTRTNIAKLGGEPEEELAQGDTPDEIPPSAALPDKQLWSVQIGAYNSPTLAAAKLSSVAKRAGGVVATAPWAVAPIEKANKTYYRARFTGFERVDAESACVKVKREGFDCFTVQDPAGRPIGDQALLTAQSAAFAGASPAPTEPPAAHP